MSPLLITVLTFGASGTLCAVVALFTRSIYALLPAVACYVTSLVLLAVYVLR